MYILKLYIVNPTASYGFKHGISSLCKQSTLFGARSSKTGEPLRLWDGETEIIFSCSTKASNSSTQKCAAHWSTKKQKGWNKTALQDLACTAEDSHRGHRDCLRHCREDWRSSCSLFSNCHPAKSRVLTTQRAWKTQYNISGKFHLDLQRIGNTKRAHLLAVLYMSIWNAGKSSSASFLMASPHKQSHKAAGGNTFNEHHASSLHHKQLNFDDAVWPHSQFPQTMNSGAGQLQSACTILTGKVLLRSPWPEEHLARPLPCCLVVALRFWFAHHWACPLQWPSLLIAWSQSCRWWNPLSKTIWRKIPCLFSRLKTQRATFSISPMASNRKKFWRFSLKSPRSRTVSFDWAASIFNTEMVLAIDLPCHSKLLTSVARKRYRSKPGKNRHCKLIIEG